METKPSIAMISHQVPYSAVCQRPQSEHDMEFSRPGPTGLLLQVLTHWPHKTHQYEAPHRIPT